MVKDILKKIEHHSPISIGMRILKTWLAATVTAFVGLTFIISNPFYALMGAVFGMQNTVSNSFLMGIGRIVGTAIGAFIGFIFASFYLDSPIAIGIAIAIVIIICILLNIKHSILITVTLCLLIMFNPTREGGLLNYTFRRTLDTTLGVVIAFFINRFIAPPNHLKSLVEQLEVLLEVSRLVAFDMNEINNVRDETQKLMAIYNNYQADEKYDKHHIKNVSLRETVEASSALYFHFSTCLIADEAVLGFHEKKICEAQSMLSKTIIQLKGVL